MIRWNRNALCFSLFAILSHKLWLRCLERDDLTAEFQGRLTDVQVALASVAAR
jgi:hypothetical protein